MKHFCTYFDHNFLSRGLCLYKSLRKFEEDFTLWVLCLTEECEITLRAMQLTMVQLISLDQLEKYDKDLKNVENTRNRVEYYFTMSPCLPLYIHYPYPVYAQKAYKGRFGNCENTERLCGQLVSLPLNPELTDDEVSYIVKAVQFSLK